MVKPNIEQIKVIELGDLIAWLAAAKGITYDEMENMTPAIYFEGDYYISDADDEEDWCKEFVSYIIENNIGSVKIYQDI